MDPRIDATLGAWGSRISPTASRSRCRAASSSAWRSPASWRWARTCSFSTNRRRSSTRPARRRSPTCSSELARAGTHDPVRRARPDRPGRLDRCLVLEGGRPLRSTLPAGGAGRGRAGSPASTPPTLVRLAVAAGLDPARAFDEAAVAEALRRRRQPGGWRRRLPRPATARPASLEARLDPGPRPAAGPHRDRGPRPPLPRRRRGRPRRDAHDRARRGGRDPRPERLGQDDAGQAPQRSAPPGRGTRPARWRADRRSPGRRSSPRIVGFVFQNPDEQLFERRVEREVAFGPRNLRLPPRTSPASSRPAWLRSAYLRGGRPTRTTSTCRGASSSRWRASWRWTRRSWSSTSRRPGRTPTASRGSGGSSRRSGRPDERSWRSPTTWSSRPRTSGGSSCCAPARCVADGPPSAIFAAGQPGPAGLDRADAAAGCAHRGTARDGSAGTRRRRPALGAPALTERATRPADRDLRHVRDAPDAHTLVVEGGPSMRILVAIDGSGSASRAVDLIASIPQLDDCLVRLVSVAPHRSEILGVPWGKAIPPDAAALEASVVGVHRRALDDARREIGSARADLEVEWSSPAGALPARSSTRRARWTRTWWSSATGGWANGSRGCWGPSPRRSSITRRVRSSSCATTSWDRSCWPATVRRTPEPPRLSWVGRCSPAFRSPS